MFTGSLISDSTKVQKRALAGMSMAMLEVKWYYLETTNSSGTPTGPADVAATYASNIQAALAAYKRAGMNVTLSTGIHFTPQWLLDLAGSRYVNQAGTQSDELNMVFSQMVRDYAARYLQTLHSLLDLNSFYAVRLHSGGGGGNGELLYPAGSAGANYWCYSTGAQNGADAPTGLAANPMPGYKPGDTGTTATQRQAFVDWYVGALANVADWQVTQLQALGYRNRWQICCPGKGSTPSGIVTAVANDSLYGAGTLPKGPAWASICAQMQQRAKAGIHVTSLADGSGTPADDVPTAADKTVALTDTAVNNWGASRWQARIAWENGFRFSGENPGRPNNAGAALTHYLDTSSNGMLAKAQAIMAGAITAGYAVDGMYWAHDADLDAGISMTQLATADTTPRTNRFLAAGGRARRTS